MAAANVPSIAAGVPSVSVVIPAWNAAQTLGACLRSVQRQTLTDWECIVVDDGSADDTASIASAFVAGDPRITVVSHPHGGVVAALNEGLRHVRAPLIARMDADDVMHRERLALQVQTLRRDSTLSAVGCHVRIFPRRGLSERRREYETWLNGLRTADAVRLDAFIECPVAHPALTMRRDMSELRYVERGWPEDYDLVLRALLAGMRIGMTPRRLLSWRDHPGRESRTNEIYSLTRFTACKAHYLAAGFLARGDEYVLWGYGATGRSLRTALAQRGKRPSHIVEVKASRIGQRIHGAPVVPIDALVTLRGVPVIVSVARQAPRAEIRSALAKMHFVEGRDYIVAA